MSRLRDAAALRAVILPTTLGLVLLVGGRATAELVPCRLAATDDARIGEALRRMQDRSDPCGESAQIGAVLDALAQCAAAYEICTDPAAARNLFERAAASADQAPRRTITWNPDLRSELEGGCDGDPTTPVLRDPTASLLHEIVHAVHDCTGLNPGEHELEAVRIENIYRRAAWLCQRSRYGDTELPPEAVKPCAPGHCACALAPREALPSVPPVLAPAHRAGPTQAADTARTPSAIEPDQTR
jgi:hypothetical protein